VRDWFRRHAAIVLGVVFVAVFGAYGYGVWTATHQRSQNCHDLEKLKAIQRHEKERAVDRAQKYLAKHPNGAPGISAALIRDSITDAQLVVRQLKPRRC
jgi:cytochrome c-type biogenesis protein CcmH/NrfG